MCVSLTRNWGICIVYFVTMIPLYPLYVLLHGITWQAGFHNCELFVSHEVNLGAANGIPTSLPRHLHPPWERLLECDSWPKMDRRNGGAFDVSWSCWICMIWDEIDDDVLYCYQTKQSRTNKPHLLMNIVVHWLEVICR